ncbi:MAG: hypothetical protein HND53_11080 [Proteobacteria bacterium]|nr:hypothetical protein [Pseudomonadota bacterium]NOG61036.1 hypothetical protein [Pseudomonadota bacterium]
MDSTTKTEIRRSNLRLLLREAGGNDQIAKRLKMEKKELAQLINLKNECSIGSWLARDIEEKLGLESGWLDISHNYLPQEARSIAQKWLVLPPALQEQIKDYIDMQIESLRFESEDDEEDITDFSKLRARESSWDS